MTKTETAEPSRAAARKVRSTCLVIAVAASSVACSSAMERKLVDTANDPPVGPHSAALDTSPDDAGAVAKVPVGTSPARGPPDAWVTMVEFSDFECPSCGYAEPIVSALLAEYSSDLRLVYKNFPLTHIHRYAEGAAVAAECAGAQGAFWEMHDLLLANQDSLDSASLLTYAQSAGVDMAAWQQCLATQSPRDAVDADVALGTSIRVRGTPTFVINGLRILGVLEQRRFEVFINLARASAQASGVPRAQYYDTVVLAP
jgi:protein-disulfide isomerase